MAHLRIGACSCNFSDFLHRVVYGKPGLRWLVHASGGFSGPLEILNEHPMIFIPENFLTAPVTLGSNPVEAELAHLTAGDRWQGIAAIGPVLIDGGTPASPLARVRMQFRRGGRLGAALDSEPGGDFPIVISNAATWSAHVPPSGGTLPLETGSWQWDAEFWQGDDLAPLTLYRGIMVIGPKITR
jgi:hypothetical protein